MHPVLRTRRFVIVAVAGAAVLACTTAGVAVAATKGSSRPALTPAVNRQLRHVVPGAAQARTLTTARQATADPAKAFKPSRRFELVARLTGEPAFIDSDDDKTLSAGDRVVFDEKLLTDGGKRDIGTLHNECTYQATFDFDAPLDLGADCRQEYVFANVGGKPAQLVGFGQQLRDDQFPVVGGTQALRRATGTVTITSQTADQTESRLLFEITVPRG